MSLAFSLIVPAIIASIAVFALSKKVDVFDAMTSGALDGLKVMLKILPALIVLLTGVYMLRASGALDALTTLCKPLFSVLGIPPETAALFLIRPITHGEQQSTTSKQTNSSPLHEGTGVSQKSKDI